MSKQRTADDLYRAVRALSYHFKTDTVIVVGSQAVLVGWPEAPALLRMSEEIDAYPDNYRDWEHDHPGEEASEEINALFGWGSHFHDTHGFYIDGVNDTTAKLPQGWIDRAVRVQVRDGDHTVFAVAPCPEDLTVSKLFRMAEKDEAYIRAWHEIRPLDIETVLSRFLSISPAPEIEARAIRFLKTIPT